MFDIAWSEMVVIGAVALIAIGPKDLPKALRAVGAMTAKARRMASEFQDHFREAMREAELESVKQEVANISQELNSAASGMSQHFNSVTQDMPNAGDAASSTPTSTQDTTPAELATATAPTVPVIASPLPITPPEVASETSVSVQASTDGITITETVKPARKKRAPAKPKSTSEAAADASPLNGVAAEPDRVKTPRKRAPKPATADTTASPPSEDDRAA